MGKKVIWEVLRLYLELFKLSSTHGFPGKFENMNQKQDKDYMFIYKTAILEIILETCIYRR